MSTVLPKKEHLKAIAQAFLQDPVRWDELLYTVKQFKNLLNSAIQTDTLDENEEVSDICLDSGAAIGTKWAALCVDDLLRTRTFIRGLHQAILEKKETTKGAPIHILYAGTGPFATLALPLTAIFEPEEVQFTFMEINPRTLSLLDKTVAHFGIEKYIREIIACDAAQYTLNSPHDIDIVLSETMQHALRKEQQVPITLNLMKQVPEHTILIPERIDLTLALASPEKRQQMLEGKLSGHEEAYIPLGNAFSLHTALVRQHQENFRLLNSAFEFPKMRHILPAEKTVEFPLLTVLTEITVYKGEKIKLNESGLTIPRILMDLSQISPCPTAVSCWYQVSKHPDLEFKLE